MGSPSSLAEFFSWLQQLQQAQQTGQPTVPSPASGSGLDANPPSLADLARRVGKPGGGFGIAGAQTGQPPVQQPIQQEGVYPDKFDAAGKRWRWNPKTQNYQVVR